MGQRQGGDHADDHDHELDEIGIDDGEHAADRRVDDDDDCKSDHAPLRRDAEDDVADNAARNDLRLHIDDGRNQNDHGSEAPHGFAVIAGLDESRQRELFRPREAGCEHCGHEPIGERYRENDPSEGPPRGIDDTDGADEDSGARVGGPYRRAPEKPAELSARDPVVGFVPRPLQGVPADSEDDDEVEREENDLDRHGSAPLDPVHPSDVGHDQRAKDGEEPPENEPDFHHAIISQLARDG